MRSLKITIFTFLTFVSLSSCSEYQKVLNKGSADKQYKMASSLYTAKKYKKALRLFEKIIPSYRGKPQMERIQFMVAQSNFNTKNYVLSGYYFDKFAKNYPKSSKKEEAGFLSALSYYKSTPRFSLDPKDTKKALEAFQSFIDEYPNSTRIKQANKYYGELRYKLEKKAFEIAKTYYRTADYDPRNYKAAIVAFDNLLSDYLGTKFKEEALYYRLKAAYDFAMVSTQRKKFGRIEDAIKKYKRLKLNFPNSKFMADANKMLTALQKEERQFQKS